MRTSFVMAHGLSCSAACEISLNHGSNLCPLHWQADSYPLYNQESPLFLIFVGALYVFFILAPYQIFGVKIFSLIHKLPFIFMIISLAVHKLSVFCSHTCFTLCFAFFLGFRFHILSFTLSSINFFVWCKTRDWFNSFACEYSIFLVSFVEQTISL